MTDSDSKLAEDAALVRAALAHQEPAIEQLVIRLRCVPRILRALNARRGRSLDEHDLADLVQDTLAIVLRKLESFHVGTSLEAWVYRICTYELMNAVRRAGRARPAAVEDAWLETAAPDVRKSEEDDHAELHQAMEQLEEREALVIRLKCFEERTFEAIARQLRLSLGTVKTRYYRGLKRLRATLSEQYQEDLRW